MSQKKIIIPTKDLPLELEVLGDKGERETYLIVSAGRKFGANLVKPVVPTR